MKFNKIEAIRYDVNLKSPFKNSKIEYSNRIGYIIKLYIDDLCGYGEAAPLDAYSKESFSQVVRGFEKLKYALHIHSNYEKNELLNLFKLYAKNLPSLHFALDISLHDILSKKNNLPISKYFNKNALDIIKFSSIYNGEVNNNFYTIKIKFGIKNLDEEINNFHYLATKYPQSTHFRIDANGAYSFDKILYLHQKLKKYNIEYIEEPFSNLNISNLEKIKSQKTFPIALDESIFNKDFKKIIEDNLVDYVIFKAPLYGSVKSIFLFLQYLNKYKIKTIFSSALQTKIGNLSNIHLAAALNLRGQHGLNNYSFFNYSKNEVPYGPNDNLISLDKLTGLGVCWDD